MMGVKAPPPLSGVQEVFTLLQVLSDAQETKSRLNDLRSAKAEADEAYKRVEEADKRLRAGEQANAERAAELDARQSALSDLQADLEAQESRLDATARDQANREAALSGEAEKLSRERSELDRIAADAEGDLKSRWDELHKSEVAYKGRVEALEAREADMREKAARLKELVG